MFCPVKGSKSCSMHRAIYAEYPILPSAEAPLFAASEGGMDAHLEVALTLAMLPLRRSITDRITSQADHALSWR